MASSKQKYSPMIMQYLEVKEKYPDTILFYRVGDFYEMFFDDAKVASAELELVLTGKDAGVENRVPMCGIPFHAYKTYLEKLVTKGYKVGIVEQLEEPGVSKLVRRDVVQIVTPGALLDLGLDEKNNNALILSNTSLPVIKSRTYVDSTEMYRVSRILKGLQFTTKYNVVRLWNDTIAGEASKENGRMIVSGIINPEEMEAIYREQKLLSKTDKVSKSKIK